MRITTEAVIVAVTGGTPRVLTVSSGERPALPSGPLAEHDKLERSVRRWVQELTTLEVGWVEQLYTFGDPDRIRGDRELSIAYLALTDEVSPSPAAAWVDWYAFFPWEDRRQGDTETLTSIRQRLSRWAGTDHERRERVGIAFGMGASAWDPVQGSRSV